MNLKQRRIYESLNDIKRKRLEKLFMAKTFKVLRSFNRGIGNILVERGIEAARVALNKTVIDTTIGEVIKNMYRVVGISYAIATYREVQRSARSGIKGRYPNRMKLIGPSGVPGGQINFNEKWSRDILEYFRMYLIDKAVVPITLESKAIISAILDRGTKEGWTIERMAKELETDKLLLPRARLIVRTETAKAAYYGRRLGAQDSGFETEKEWIAAMDSRTRHSHRDVDGEMVEFNGRFNVAIYRGRVLIGHEMLRGPGDPEASAANVCNCRCTESYAAKRDQNGRLIRKPVTRVSIIQPGSFNRPITTITI